MRAFTARTHTGNLFARGLKWAMAAACLMVLVAPAAVSAQSRAPVATVPVTVAKITPCGGPNNHPYTPSIDIGCQGKGNPIMDALFGIINFLSDGVGVVVVASLVLAGIQLTTSRGDSQATAAAIKRMRSNIVALFIFIFAYAILNYVVPGQVLK